MYVLEKTFLSCKTCVLSYCLLLYSYNFNPIKNTHLRHVTVHYFSVLYNRKPYFFRIGRRDKSVFFSYCTLCKGSNSLIFVICLLELVIIVEHSMIILIELKYIVSLPFDWTLNKTFWFDLILIWRTLSPIFFSFVHNSMNFSICKP